ncbi:MAG: hypothetical protein HY816_15920 [Candidatus Wallbacteria bacterium]|nr:hypothetical protein [Candidatus Wallbacteria bacterium]
MAGLNARPVGSFFEFLTLLLERGIVVRDGRKDYTFTLGSGKAAARVAAAAKELPAAAPKTNGRRKRKVKTKAKAAAAPALKRAAKAKPGRPPKQAAKSKPAKKPAPKAPAEHDILVELDKNRVTGLGLRSLAKHFGVKADIMRKALAPLEANKRITFYKKTRTYMPEGKVRVTASKGVARKSPPRGQPISPDAILNVLREAGSALDRHEIAARLGVNYHKLIRRMSAVVDSGAVKQDGNKFGLA